MAVSLGDAWGISGIRLAGQSVLVLILGPGTVPGVSAYGPDNLFQAVMGVWGVTPVACRCFSGILALANDMNGVANEIFAPRARVYRAVGLCRGPSGEFTICMA